MANLFRCTGVGSGEDIQCLERAYDSTTTYNADDTTLYEGELYICLEDGVTGTWNVSKWKRAYLEELSGLNSNLNDNRGGYSIYIDGLAEPSICCGLFYKDSNWRLLHQQHWLYTELGTQTWYDIQLKWNQTNTNFVITALNECYYSYNIDMSNKQKLSKGEIISIYHRNATTVYFQSI